MKDKRTRSELVAKVADLNGTLDSYSDVHAIDQARNEALQTRLDGANQTIRELRAEIDRRRAHSKALGVLTEGLRDE